MYKKINFENAIKRINLGETILVRANDGSLFPVDDVEDNLVSFSKYDYYREIKIKDCPDCGSDALLYKDKYSHYVVSCSSCGCNYITHETEDWAVNVWNKQIGEQ